MSDQKRTAAHLPKGAVFEDEGFGANPDTTSGSAGEESQEGQEGQEGEELRVAQHLPGWSPRPATVDDVAHLTQIESRVHVAPWTHDHFAAELAKPYSHILVLSDDETDSVIAGYAVFWTLGDESQLLNIAVDLEYRGRGVAQWLMQVMKREALKMGLKRIFLEVRKSNAAAISLYQKQGFVITQTRKNFYSNGEDAYVMNLPLDEDRLATDF
jgi:ribosomal-protein-alanine N-acetyltransferase